MGPQKEKSINRLLISHHKCTLGSCLYLPSRSSSILWAELVRVGWVHAWAQAQRAFPATGTRVATARWESVDHGSREVFVFLM